MTPSRSSVPPPPAPPSPVIMTAGQLRARAAEYRQMAATARMVGSADALLRLAARFDALADQEDLQARAGRPSTAQSDPNR